MQVAAGPGVGPGKHRNSQQANQTVHRPIERRGSRSGAYCPDRVPCLELGEIEPLQSLGENHCQSRKDMASKLFSERARDCGENFPKKTSKLAEPAIPNSDSVKGKDESKGSYFTGPNLSLSYPPSLFRSEALSSLGTQGLRSASAGRGIYGIWRKPTGKPCRPRPYSSPVFGAKNAEIFRC